MLNTHIFVLNSKSMNKLPRRKQAGYYKTNTKANFAASSGELRHYFPNAKLNQQGFYYLRLPYSNDLLHWLNYPFYGRSPKVIKRLPGGG